MYVLHVFHMGRELGSLGGCHGLGLIWERVIAWSKVMLVYFVRLIAL